MLVKVRGRVPPLSVIVPSGCDDGVGVAIPKSSLPSHPYAPVIALPLHTDSEEEEKKEEEEEGRGKVRLILAMRTEAVNEIWTNLLCNEVERFKTSQQSIEEIQKLHQLQLDHLHAVLLHLSQFLPRSLAQSFTPSPSSSSSSLSEGETKGGPEEEEEVRKKEGEKKEDDVTPPPPHPNPHYDPPLSHPHHYSSLDSFPPISNLSLSGEGVGEDLVKERGGKRSNSIDSFPSSSYTSISVSIPPSSHTPPTNKPQQSRPTSTSISLSSSSILTSIQSMSSYPSTSNQFQYEVIKFRPRLQKVDGRLICKEIDLLLLDHNVVKRLKEEMGTTSILEPGKSNVIYSLPLVGTNLTEPLSNTIIIDLHYKSSIFTFAFQKRSAFLSSDIDLIRSQQCKIYVNGYAFEFIVRNKLVARLVRVQHISQHPIEELFDCDLIFRSSSRIRSKILPLSKRWIEKYQLGQPSPFNGFFASKLMNIPSQEYFLLCSYCKKRQWTDVAYFILSPNPDHYSTFESLSDVQLAAIEHSLLFEVNKILQSNDELKGIHNEDVELITPHDRAILLCSYYLSLTPFGPMSLENLLTRSSALIKSFATSDRVKERLEDENGKWESMINSFHALFIVLQTNSSFLLDNNFSPLFSLLFHIAQTSEKKESFSEFRDKLKTVAIEVGKKYSSTPSLSSSPNYKTTVTSLSSLLSFFHCEVPFTV